MGSKERARVCVGVCVLHAICRTIGPHTHPELRIGASQLSRLLTVDACTFAGVCVCGGGGFLLPPHVSNTKPSNCPHDPREEDQPERNGLMDRGGVSWNTEERTWAERGGLK